MQEELTHRDVATLFGALVDHELAAPEELRLRAHLESCDDCQMGWDRYERAVKALRGVGREQAPPALAGLILRRVRRQHFGARALALAHVRYRVPVEGILVPLIAAAIAALLYFLVR